MKRQIYKLEVVAMEEVDGSETRLVRRMSDTGDMGRAQCRHVTKYIYFVTLLE